MAEIDPKTGHFNDRTFGQRLADTVAAYVGSWTFLIVKNLIFAGWIVINTSWLSHRHWDPYPYILLNLILSLLATLENSVIVMAEGRAADRDRALARWDHKLTVKAEADNQKILQHIILLVEKLDGKEEP